MNLTSIRKKDCDIGRDCPEVSRTDRGSLVIQGYVPAPAAVASAGFIPRPGWRAVEIPLSLVPEFGVPGWPCLHPTARESVLVFGRELTDPTALAKVDIPPGEAIVELAVTDLPALEPAHA